MFGIPGKQAVSITPTAAAQIVSRAVRFSGSGPEAVAAVGAAFAAPSIEVPVVQRSAQDTRQWAAQRVKSAGAACPHIPLARSSLNGINGW